MQKVNSKNLEKEIKIQKNKIKALKNSVPGLKRLHRKFVKDFRKDSIKISEVFFGKFINNPAKKLISSHIEDRVKMLKEIHEDLLVDLADIIESEQSVLKDLRRKRVSKITRTKEPRTKTTRK